MKRLDDPYSKRYTKEEIERLKKRYIGKEIKIINMDDKFSGKHYIGKTGKVEHVDDLGQLFGTWGGLALIPGLDEFILI